MNKKNILNYAAILAVCFFSGTGNFLSAAINTFKEAFPSVSQATIMMVSTLPGIISVPVLLLVGRLVGKKISYKLTCIVGSILIVIGGVLPYFATSWTFVLVCRAILGIGAGCYGVRNTFIIKSVPPEKQATFTGYSTVLLTVGGTLSGPIVGALASKGWNYVFLYDLIPVLILVLVIIGLKEPPEESIGKNISEISDKQEKKTAGEGKLSWKIYFYAVLQLLILGTVYPMAVSGTSIFMDEYGLGSASIAGLVLSIFPLFGIIGSLFLAPILRKLKRFTIPCMTVFVIVGQALSLFIHSTVVVIISIALMGLGYHVIMGLLQVYNGQEAPPSKTAIGSTLILAFKQIGIFLSSYFITICAIIFKLPGLDLESAFVGCIIIYAAIGIFTLLVNVTPGKATAVSVSK